MGGWQLIAHNDLMYDGLFGGEMSEAELVLIWPRSYLPITDDRDR